MDYLTLGDIYKGRAVGLQVSGLGFMELGGCYVPEVLLFIWILAPGFKDAEALGEQEKSCNRFALLRTQNSQP